MDVPEPPEWQTFEPTPEQVPPHSIETALDVEMPPFWIEVSQRLHDAGYPALADAELREVEVTFEADDGTPGRVRVQAFTRTPDEGPPWAFVDGVWRQVHGMGPPRDVVVECARAALLRENATEWQDDVRARRQFFESPIGEATRATSDHAFSRAETLCDGPAAVQPLLRHGRADLAARVLGGQLATPEATAVRLLLGWGGELTRESWLAFLSGRDHALREYLGTLRRVFPAIRGYGVDPSAVFRPAFELMEELERGGPGAGALAEDAPVEAGDAESLIARLDELGVMETVRVTGNWRHPDFVSNHRVAGSSIARRLADLGAVGPLLDCVSHDARRSRSFQVTRSLFSGEVGWSREPLPVARLCALIVEPMLADDHVLIGPDVHEAAALHAERAGRSDASIAETFLARRDTSLARLTRTARWLTLEREPLAGTLSISQATRLRRHLVRRARELGARREDTVAFCDLAHAALAWEPDAARRFPRDLPCLSDGGWCQCAPELAVALRHQRPHEVAAWAARAVPRVLADLSLAELLLEVRAVRSAVARELDRAQQEPRSLVAFASHAAVLLAVVRGGTLPEAASLLRAGLASTAAVSEPVAPLDRRSASPLEPLRGRTVAPAHAEWRVADLYARALAPAGGVPFTLDASVDERDLRIDDIQRALAALP